MTVAALPSVVSYVEDGATVAFPVPYRFRASGLTVDRIVDGLVSPLAIGVDYTATGGETDAGGTLTRTAATSGGVLRIRRSTSLEQSMTYATGDRFPAQSHEDALDQRAMVSQDLARDVSDIDNRALLAPPGETIDSLGPLIQYAGKALGFDAAKRPVPIAIGDANDPGLRSDLADPNGLRLAGFSAAGVGAAVRTGIEKLRERVSPADYWFVTDIDDTASIERALAAAHVVDLDARSYRVRDLRMLSFRWLRGAGKSPWEPYTGIDKPVGYLTELVVEAGDAINARGTNSATVTGIAFAAKGGRQSRYRFQPGYVAGTGGIAITGSTRFQARDVSFFGLEYAVHSHLTTTTIPGGGTVSGVETDEAAASANPTQMPLIDDWQASDCYRVFAFGNASSDRYTARDVRISNQVVALHCGSIIEAHYCDGVRVENVRFYQCTGSSIRARKCVFISIVGATIFETGLEGVVLIDCENTTISGVEIGRTGFYQVPSGTPQVPIYAQYAAVRLERCITTHISGIIEKPTGMSVSAYQCTTLSLSLSLDTPFWLTGNATNLSGAIDLRLCDFTTVHAAVGGENHQVTVWADTQSRDTLAGAISGNRVGGVVRAVHLQQLDGYRYRIPADQEMVAGAVWNFDVLRVLVPAGKKVVTRSVELTTQGVALRARGLTWAAETLPEPGGGSIAFDDKVLADNSAGSRTYVSVPLAVVNLSGATLTARRGDEIRISLAVV